MFSGQIAANETASDDDSDGTDSDDSDGDGDSFSSSFNKEKITSEIRDSMVKLIVVSSGGGGDGVDDDNGISYDGIGCYEGT